MQAICPPWSSSGFFQFPAEYEKIKKEIFPDHISKFGELRIWVCPSSTGEWAYSLAIICQEIMKENKITFPLQIIGSDIDAARVKFAQVGEYRLDLFLMSLRGRPFSKDRKKLKYFNKTEMGYQVKKEIRDMVKFYVRDVTEDPPFTDINFLSSRWLLPWFDLEVQKKIIGIFQRSVLPGGCMVLNGDIYFRRP